VCWTELFADDIALKDQDDRCGREYFYVERTKRGDDLVPIVLEASMRDDGEWNRMTKLVGRIYFDLVENEEQISMLAQAIMGKLFPWDERNDREDLLKMYPAKGNS